MVGSDVFPIEMVPFFGDMLIFRGVRRLIWMGRFEHPPKSNFDFTAVKTQKATASFAGHSKKYTPWKFNSSPLKISHPKRKVIFQPSFFRDYVKLRGCKRSDCQGVNCPKNDEELDIS